MPNIEKVYELEKNISAEVNEVIIPEKLLKLIPPAAKDSIKKHNKEAEYAKIRIMMHCTNVIGLRPKRFK